MRLFSLLARLRPQDLYAVLATIFGGLFLALTPPFGAGDEPAHFERAFEVATGEWLGAEGLPAGYIAFIETGYGAIREREAITAATFDSLAAIELQADRIEPYPEPARAILRIHNPLAYLHLAPAAWAGLAFDLDPIVIFYLSRLSSLIAALLLIRHAITVAPGAKYLMAAVALLPTAVAYLGAISIDPLTLGLSFAFFAHLARAAAEPGRRLDGGALLILAGLAFFLAQTKTPYAALPLCVLLLPASKFVGAGRRIASAAIVVAPGVVAAIAWALLVRENVLAGLVYQTDGGDRVAAGEQMALILADPAGFAMTLARTLASPAFLGEAWMTFIAAAGWGHIAAPAFAYGVATAALLLVWLNDAPPPAAFRGPLPRLFQAGLFAAILLAALSLLYLQWTGVGAARVAGFQGRYLYAMAPLVFALAPLRMSLFATPARLCALVVGAASISLAATFGAMIGVYYG